MNTNSHTIGAIEVFFEKDHVIDPEEQGLVYYMATALANAITNTSLIKELKIANADLEASQWELLGSRNILRALFDNMPLSIYIIDPKYNLIAVNQSRANRLSQSPKNLVGKKCYQVLYNRKSPCPGCSVQSTFNYGKVTTRKTQEWNETNIPTEWEISTYPITGDNNLISKTIILEKDITEERELEESLIQSEKLAAVGQLAAGVAHEINNPLSAVIANAQLLLLDLPEDDDLLESVKLIELAGKRASQVVRNLLGFARKEQMDFDAVDINETIQSALSLLRHELMLHKVQLNIDLDDNMPPAIISSDHLHSVWINLIINAIDAIETTNAEISITSQYINQEFVITVADNGKGMDAEQKKHVFEPFYTTKRPGKGTGLGLSVCHRIIKQHGGNINIESKIDTGTKMIVKIPAHFSEIGKNNL